MVGSPLTLLLGIAVFVACFGAAVGKPMSIDQKIMAAAKDPRMFDLIHIMPNGEMMMMVQLDMLLTPHQYRLMQGNANRRGKRKALIENAPTNDGTLFLTRWPEGQVFYEIIDSFKQNKSMLTVIEQAIEEWERYTCLNFTAVDNTSEPEDRIVFTYGEMCASSLGRKGGLQDVFLGYDCFEKSIVIHEIGHAIGWIHEHTRPERNRYVYVDRRIVREYPGDLERFDRGCINDYGVQYDYRSIMHYGGDVSIHSDKRNVTAF
ncbi:hypothetical protein BaRGS_00034276 [Batillaria attramentaria]|uniref:Metalloendopeptidase n=1 Tax=Batillaria attramentaria TaxID=370345 RepID=A0ABD0JHN3_9CAEN